MTPSGSGEALEMRTGIGDDSALWPTPEQVLLLRAALPGGQGALEAWSTWRSRHDLVESHLDRGSFRLLPLLYRNLVALGSDDPDLPRLKGIYRYWWCSNQRLLYQAAGLVRDLEQAGVPCIVLKGAAAATLHYRDAGVRPMGDIDVMVPLDRAALAVRHLESLGWRANRRHIQDLIRYQHSVTMEKDGASVDIHWQVFRECIQGDAGEGFWRRSVPLEFLGAHCRGLGPGDALLHAVVHGIRWREEPTVRWIPDALAILHSCGDAIDWDALREEACARRLLLRFVRGLEYLRENFDAPIPDAAFERLRRTPATPLERLEFRLLTLGADGNRKLQLGHAPLFAVTYLRLVSRRSPFHKLAELPAFLRYRLRNRREPAILAVRRVKRTLRRAVVQGIRAWLP
jgi:hypothetical protein